MLSKFRPIQVAIKFCENISQLFQYLPTSVICLELIGNYNGKLIDGDCHAPLKFKKLNLINYKQPLDILSKYATATERLTIDAECLKQDGVIEYLAQMDCKNIIVQTNNLFIQRLKDFLTMKSKALKYIIKNDSIELSSLETVEWAFSHLANRKFIYEEQIELDIEHSGAETLLDRLFKGSLSIFKKKNIQVLVDITFNPNVCLPNPDTLTESISINDEKLALFALNNCICLKKLEIDLEGISCIYSALAAERLVLQELLIENANESFIPIVSDILKKSKDTLCSLKCSENIVLSNLRNSKVLKQLVLYKCANDANLEIIGTFSNLEVLSTDDERIVKKFIAGSKLKIFTYMESLSKSEIKILPQSVTIVYIYGNDFNSIRVFLEQNPALREVNTALANWHEAAYLFGMFKYVKFNFGITTRLFTFHQSYVYLHPESKLLTPTATEPDHIVYELLYQRLTHKIKLFWPYCKALTDMPEVGEYLAISEPQMIDLISSFKEFQYCLISRTRPKIEKLEASHFDKVFNFQIVQFSDYEYLRIILSTYDEVFKLGGNIDQQIKVVQGMTQQERQTINRLRFFEHCRQNWQSPLSGIDFNKKEKRYF
ncbi:hypothetical protein FGO68_gene10500 [Halteria grandinella]|uniref:Uncharacterized protein n=1 Tax=Halteria grandinella TaxID=5974 RepID=A0A8J8T6N0_HALGN|nr:hypothetical protein FGO68_gene10500 [Halteria grandinella]